MRREKQKKVWNQYSSFFLFSLGLGLRRTGSIAADNNIPVAQSLRLRSERTTAPTIQLSIFIIIFTVQNLSHTEGEDSCARLRKGEEDCFLLFISFNINILGANCAYRCGCLSLSLCVSCPNSTQPQPQPTNQPLPPPNPTHSLTPSPQPGPAPPVPHTRLPYHPFNLSLSSIFRGESSSSSPSYPLPRQSHTNHNTSNPHQHPLDNKPPSRVWFGEH